MRQYRTRLELEAAYGPLSDDVLVENVRILQRKKGHRFSLDDVLTAYEACRVASELKTDCTNVRYLDLGCGIASVLLSVAIKSKPCVSVGLEAQRVSFEIASYNVEQAVAKTNLNMKVSFCDIRTLDSQVFEAPFDLITGTPPYAPISDVVPSPDSQRQYARVEMRGGVEVYLKAAVSQLAPDGVFVMCAAETQSERVERAVATSGLYVRECMTVVPRVGKGPLFRIWTFVARPESERKESSFIARDATGARTAAHKALSAFFANSHKSW